MDFPRKPCYTVGERKRRSGGAGRRRRMKETDSGKNRRYGAVVAGGGASGLMCAYLLGKAGIRVLLLEKNGRLGRKLSQTGNGQGNITNTDMSPAHYFSDDPEKVRSVLERFSEKDLLQTLEEAGGIFSADERGRVYPVSRQASSVTDLFRLSLGALSCDIRTGTVVSAIRQRGRAFEVFCSDGSVFIGESAVIACGGKAAPHFGTDGDGYALAASFGHTVTELRPSLVQLKADRESIRGLKGVRVADCAAALVRNGRTVREVSGDVLFSDGVVSGDAVFRLSCFYEEGDLLRVDFAPGLALADLTALLERKRTLFPDEDAEELFRTVAAGPVARNILRRNGVRAGTKCGGVRCTEKLAETAKRFSVPLTGSAGFSHAQVTKGGVPLSETDANLMSRFADGLYLCGEVLNADGECGGYNLQWAFSSGAVVAGGIAERDADRRN